MSKTTDETKSTDIEAFALDVASALTEWKVDRDDLEFAMSFDQAIAGAGLEESQLSFVASPYRVVKDKNELVNQPFYIRFFRIAIDEKTDRPYVVVYAITRGDEMVIFTDGSTGVFRQLTKEAQRRIDEGHPVPNGAILVLNGLRVSEYGIDKDGKPVGSGVKPDSMAETFYLG